MIRTKLDTEELRIVLETMLRLRERIRDNVVSVGLCGELAVLLPGGIPVDDLRELLFDLNRAWPAARGRQYWIRATYPIEGSMCDYEQPVCYSIDDLDHELGDSPDDTLKRVAYLRLRQLVNLALGENVGSFDEYYSGYFLRGEEINRLRLKWLDALYKQVLKELGAL